MDYTINIISLVTSYCCSVLAIFANQLIARRDCVGRLDGGSLCWCGAWSASVVVVFAQDVNTFNYIFIIFYNEYRQMKIERIQNFDRLIKGKWLNNGGKAPCCHHRQPQRPQKVSARSAPLETKRIYHTMKSQLFNAFLFCLVQYFHSG